jgi:hypothetical protein
MNQHGGRLDATPACDRIGYKIACQPPSSTTPESPRNTPREQLTYLNSAKLASTERESARPELESAEVHSQRSGETTARPQNRENRLEFDYNRSARKMLAAARGRTQFPAGFWPEFSTGGGKS